LRFHKVLAPSQKLPNLKVYPYGVRLTYIRPRRRLRHTRRDAAGLVSTADGRPDGAGHEKAVALIGVRSRRLLCLGAMGS